MARARPNQAQAHPSPATPPDPSNWKDHPVVVAAIAVAATIGLAVVLVKEIVLPTHTAAQTNELTSLRSRNESQSKELAKLQQEVKKAQAQVSELNERLFDAQHANLFAPGDPYPTGLRKVKIGDPLSRVSEAFPANAEIQKKDGYWVVQNQHTVFDRVAYYFDENSTARTITHINFSVGFVPKLRESFLYDKLLETLGTPRTWKRKRYYSWKSAPQLAIYNNDDLSFLVMAESRKPGYWPDQ